MPSLFPLPSLSLLLLLISSVTPPTTASFNWDITTHGVVPGWPWGKPWPHDDSALMQFDELCRATATFSGRQYKFSELDGEETDLDRRQDKAINALSPTLPLHALSPCVRSLAAGRVYPGSWDGVNVKGPARDLLLVEWAHIPRPARTWIEARLQSETGRPRHFFTLVDKAETLAAVAALAKSGGSSSSSSSNSSRDDSRDSVVDHCYTESLDGASDQNKLWITAPGELYKFLPLWVAEGSECEGALKDLTTYVPTRAKDTCVVAWPVYHSRPLLEHGKNEINFTIQARLVKETDDGRAARIFWEKHHRDMHRLHRKIDREQREASKKAVERDRGAPRDEL